MFDKKEEVGKVAPTSSPSSSADDVIVHVMPKQFYGREVVVPQSQIPVSQPQIPPVAPPPQPKPLTPVPQATPEKKPLSTIEKKSSKAPVIISLFLLFLIMAGAFGAGYIYFFAPELNPFVTPTPAPEPKPEPTPEPKPEPVPEPEPMEPVPGTDTDSDGLTNVEELMYGTDFRDPDTDKDTFLDGNEVFHRYHPNGVAPETLLDTGAVRVFQNAELPFTVYYPTSWTPVVSRTSPQVTFRAPSTASVIITWETKDPDEELEDWYELTIDGGDARDLEPTYTKEGYYALTKRDDRVAYLDAQEIVYTFTYDLGDETTIEFLQTFQMMVNSFDLLP